MASGIVNRFYSVKNLAFEQKIFLLITVGFIVTVVLFFSPYIYSLHTHWSTPDDIEFGYLLLALSIFLAVKNIDTSQAPQHNYFYVAMLVGVALALSIVLILDLKTTILLALLLYWPIAVGSIMGHRYALSMLLPVAILFMAMPAWYLFISLLQGLTVKVVSLAIEPLEIAAFIEGNYFTIPTGVIHVAGGCSGLKYFITAITLALIASALSKRSLWTTALSVLIGALLAIIANWIRVFILILVGYYSGIDHPLMEDHDNLGWVVFAVTMLPWFYCERYIFDREKEHKNSATNTTLDKSIRVKPTLFISALCVGIAVLPSFATQLLHLGNTDRDKAYELPWEIAGWTRVSSMTRSWYPAYAGADQTLHSSLLKQTTLAQMTILNYIQQHQNKEMANVSNTIFDSQHWKTLSDQGIAQPDIPFPAKLAVGTDNKGTYHLVVYWFNHGAYTANSILSSKWLQLAATLSGEHSSQLVAIAIPCPQNCAQPLAAMQAIKPLAIAVRQWLIEQGP